MGGNPNFFTALTDGFHGWGHRGPSGFPSAILPVHGGVSGRSSSHRTPWKTSARRRSNRSPSGGSSSPASPFSHVCAFSASSSCGIGGLRRRSGSSSVCGPDRGTFAPCPAPAVSRPSRPTSPRIPTPSRHCRRMTSNCSVPVFALSRSRFRRCRSRPFSDPTDGRFPSSATAERTRRAFPPPFFRRRPRRSYYRDCTTEEADYWAL